MLRRLRPGIVICCLAFVLAGTALPQRTREEINRRQRREQAELDREWDKKYEADWKAYLVETKQPYRRWVWTKQRDRKRYQEYRLTNGMQRLPFDFLHR